MRNHSRILIAALGACVAMPACAIGLQMGHRPEIGAVEAPKTAKPGETVKITVKAKNDGSASCGLLVKFGDGSDQQMKMNTDNNKFPVSFEHAYKKNGRYTVSASGTEITTHKACKNSASAPIQVGPPAKTTKSSAKPKS